MQTVIINPTNTASLFQNFLTSQRNCGNYRVLMTMPIDDVKIAVFVLFAVCLTVRHI